MSDKKPIESMTPTEVKDELFSYLGAAKDKYVSFHTHVFSGLDIAAFDQGARFQSDEDSLTLEPGVYLINTGAIPQYAPGEFLGGALFTLAEGETPDSIIKQATTDGGHFSVDPVAFHDGTHVTADMALLLLATANEFDEGNRDAGLRLLDLWTGYHEHAHASAQRKRKYTPSVKDGFNNISPLTNALMSPHNKQYISTDKIFSGEATSISLGSAGELKVTAIGGSLSLEEITLDETQRYWLDAVEAFANEGIRTIRGTKILEHKGIKNPYKESAEGTLAEAAKNLYALTKLDLLVDTSADKSAADKSVKTDFTARGLITGEFHFQERVRKDGSTYKDFEIVLDDRYSTVDAVQTLKYAKERNQYIEAPPIPKCLEGVSMQTTHRKAWFYIQRQILNNRLDSDGILIDTLLQSLGIDLEDNAAGRKKLKRMLDKIQEMLDAAMKGGKDGKSPRMIAGWRYAERHGKPYKIVITPLEGEG